jgi:hypothetical protein
MPPGSTFSGSREPCVTPSGAVSEMASRGAFSEFVTGVR